MALTIHRFDPSGCNFPPSRVPMWPAWHRATFKHWTWPAAGSTNASSGVPRTRGRYALHAGLKALALGPGSVLLAPAYHCRSMLDAAIALGATIRFYRLDERLQPDLADVSRLVGTLDPAAGGPRPHAILAAHLFGIETQLQGVRNLCDREGLALIEDCAHCLVDSEGHLPAILQAGAKESKLGRWGDIVIASPYKHLPLGEGGMVWARIPGLAIERGHRPPLSRACRAGARLVRSALQSQASSPYPPEGVYGSTSPCGHSVVEEDRDAPSDHFDSAQASDRGLALARWLAGGCDLRSAAQRRRHRYMQWLQACRPWQLRGLCSPLQDELDDTTVPYVFPLNVPQGEQVFAQLRGQGLPAGRWDELASLPGDPACPWRLSLLHLPVHQEIEDEAMNWMLDVFADAMTRAETAD